MCVRQCVDWVKVFSHSAHLPSKDRASFDGVQSVSKINPQGSSVWQGSRKCYQMLLRICGDSLVGPVALMPTLVDEERALPLGGEVAVLLGALEDVVGAGAVHLHVLPQVRLLSEAFPTHRASATGSGSHGDMHQCQENILLSSNLLYLCFEAGPEGHSPHQAQRPVSLSVGTPTPLNTDFCTHSNGFSPECTRRWSLKQLSRCEV